MYTAVLISHLKVDSPSYLVPTSREDILAHFGDAYTFYRLFTSAHLCIMTHVHVHRILNHIGCIMNRFSHRGMAMLLSLRIINSVGCISSHWLLWPSITLINEVPILCHYVLCKKSTITICLMQRILCAQSVERPIVLMIYTHICVRTDNYTNMNTKKTE